MVDNKKIENDIKEKLVAINRITKVVKGGRRFGFAALVVVGNQKGSYTFSLWGFRRSRCSRKVTRFS